MVFSSYLFIFFFLPLTLLLYYASPNRWRHLCLTLMSYIFYGWANPAFMFLMFFTTCVDYSNGRFMQMAPRHKKIFLSTSIVINLGILAFFKYFNFGLENYNAALTALGLESYCYRGFFRVVLPLGISFYTFQSMSYVIDVYRGDAAVITRFIDYACYISMFPQLVAGPIIRFQDIARQLQHRVYSWEKFSRGIAFFMLGMAKKVLLANPCGKVADLAFETGGSLSCLDAWYGITAYAMQIYYDFSGYSDMAIGLGLMLGFVFAKNFDSPYKSKSITEFWRRWHLSLSSWLRDYLYIPLGGNRKGVWRTYINLALVMLLGGLWHGASWNFLIWGGIHGGWLAFERAQGKHSFYRKLPSVLQVACTFLIVLLAWVFFRALTLPEAYRYVGSLFALTKTPPSSLLIRGLIYNPYYLGHFFLAGILVWAAPSAWDFSRKLTAAKISWCIIVFIMALLTLITQGYNPFIYFIF
ncbi:MAG: hypothetical protein PHG44_06055 [Lentisphaeria bacterium]|jgi:alginate O-acetyltransferase complex protein AlgI|nr:hypothetical protein [Lentisphaeria bacterium]MDY0176517.1 MBOAT family O-acyltransferase [Lentisphaeria bacterium]NLZ59042.1 MBOAT family protein [Lentisphaerota bacterium]